MKKIIFLSFLLVCFASVPAFASYRRITTQEQGVITEIIDGDAIQVRLYSGEGAYVRLIGVDAEGFDNALSFLTNYALGKQVTLVPDSRYGMSGRFNLLYVYMDYDDNVMLNKVVIEKGFAKADTAYDLSIYYGDLVAAQSSPKSKGVGIWSDGSTTRVSSYYYTGDMVNINTASASQLADLLEDVSNTTASSIVSYRRHNPFNTIEELKFVPNFTKTMFDENKSLVTVITNINEASEKELTTLGLSEDDVSGVIKYRNRYDFKQLTEFYSKTTVSRSKYDNISHFISLTTNDEKILKVAEPTNVVNINTASEAQLKKIDNVSASMASRIIEYRNNYYFKTLTELRKISGINISATDIQKWEDNLHIATDINYASEEELRSLFGSDSESSLVRSVVSERPYRSISEIKSIVGDTKYAAIENFIYVDQYYAPTRININTAAKQQLTSVGLSDSDATKILDKQQRMMSIKDVPISTSGIAHQISLYTNVNTASLEELNSLHPAMSSKMTDEIHHYRQEQPFGSIEELEDLFREKDERSMFLMFKDFVVVQ